MRKNEELQNNEIYVPVKKFKFPTFTQIAKVYTIEERNIMMERGVAFLDGLTDEDFDEVRSKTKAIVQKYFDDSRKRFS